MNLTRRDMEVRSELFDRFALKDQKSYYKSAVSKHREATRQVNQIRALMAFLTGVAAALAAFIVQGSFVSGASCSVADAPASCDTLMFFVSMLSILAIILPALGGAFSTLADLYQWDKLVAIYDTARLNMEEADALSPRATMPDDVYRASMRAFSEGTLQVMSDETSQWGQSIRTPLQIEHYLQEERNKSQQVTRNFRGQIFDEANRLKPDDDKGGDTG